MLILRCKTLRILFKLPRVTTLLWNPEKKASVRFVAVAAFHPEKVKRQL